MHDGNLSRRKMDGALAFMKDRFRLSQYNSVERRPKASLIAMSALATALTGYIASMLVGLGLHWLRQDL